MENSLGPFIVAYTWLPSMFAPLRKSASGYGSSRQKKFW